MKLSINSSFVILIFAVLKFRNIGRSTPHSIEISIEILQYCKNIFEAIRKISKILQEPCNVRLKHYKWNIAAILIFHFNIAVM